MASAIVNVLRCRGSNEEGRTLSGRIVWRLMGKDVFVVR